MTPQQATEEVLGQDDRAPHEPVADDLSAVQADDKLLDALGSATPAAAGSLVDDELNALMLAWRNEIDSVDPGDLVDLDTAVATIADATRTWWNTTGRWFAVLLLAVIVAVAITLTVIERGAA